ncbi:MAG: eukaryotic-like serine/threonine-protein kinase [Blastocatellia bacterium]|jgi:TolB-like protein/cytochrome c-type biogenesis protein CcmH/NrfG|nr:eukaryotic-like serine/threonine-protein kinase [Blastocatellia bacterium]
MSEQDEENSGIDLEAATARLPSRPVEEQTTASDFPLGPLKEHATLHTGQMRTIAVLPFKNLGGAETGDDQYLGLGMTDALITTLSNLRQLVVRPTNAVVRFTDPVQDLLIAGNELGVDVILDGRVQRAGERVRVTVQLVSVQDGAPLWAEKFDEKWTDIFTVQDSISAQVTQALMLQLSGAERRRLAKHETESADAYQAYLRGRYYWNQFTEEGFQRAIASFMEAIRIDPEYALAYAGLGDLYNWLGVFSVLPPRDTWARGRKMAARAVALDDTLAEAHAALGFARLCSGWDWTGGERELRRAIELNPHYATAHQWYCFQLTAEGRFAEAVTELQAALAIDPHSPFILQALAWIYYMARDYERSIECHRKVLELDAQFALGYLSFGRPLGQQGRHTEAIAALKRAVELSGESPIMLAGLGAAYALGGRERKARETLLQLADIARQRYVSPYQVALIHCGLGEPEEAFQCLEQTFAEQDAWLTWARVEPQLDPLRDDPRFAHLLQRIGLGR